MPPMRTSVVYVPSDTPRTFTAGAGTEQPRPHRRALSSPHCPGRGERRARAESGDGGAAGIEASRPQLRLEGCDGVPRSEQAVAGLADVGFPVFVAAARRSCVPFEVTPDGGRMSRVVVSLGAGEC
jgi:hypothetical protein